MMTPTQQKRELKKLKDRMRYRAEQLLNPHYGEGGIAHFPQWDASMTTAQYIDQFTRINHHTRPRKHVTYTHSDGVPAQPETTLENPQ